MAEAPLISEQSLLSWKEPRARLAPQSGHIYNLSLGISALLLNLKVHR